MFLKNLSLTNFRNLKEVSLNFSSLTLLLGKNAQGKSNLLESIYFLATTKSPRAEKDLELIKQGENFCRVEGEVGEEGLRQIDYSLQKKAVVSSQSAVSVLTKLEISMQVKTDNNELLEKRLKVNGVSRRALDYLGNLIVVYFAPEDINLVTGSPSLRRWFLDLSLAQTDREYKVALTNYVSVLASRNRLLKQIKEGQAKVEELKFWTNELIKNGQIINLIRTDFFEKINVNATQKTSPLGKFKFNYLPSILNESRSKEYLDKEIAAGVSLIGPHRDDFMFLIDGKDLSLFGSRGEQRTAVLELKLNQLEFIKQIKGAIPVLLLDDVFSELDEVHKEYIFSITTGQQTIISAIEGENIPQKLLDKAQVVRVEKGTIGCIDV